MASVTLTFRLIIFVFKGVILVTELYVADVPDEFEVHGVAIS